LSRASASAPTRRLGEPITMHLENYLIRTYHQPVMGTLPQQAQTIESISGHTYIRKRISLTFFVKKLILWSERLCQRFLSDAAYFVCRAVTFFNEINLHPHSSYYLRNTVKLIRRSSSIIDEYIYPISPRDVKQKAPPHGQCVDN